MQNLIKGLGYPIVIFTLSLPYQSKASEACSEKDIEQKAEVQFLRCKATALSTRTQMLREECDGKISSISIGNYISIGVERTCQATADVVRDEMINGCKLTELQFIRSKTRQCRSWTKPRDNHRERTRESERERDSRSNSGRATDEENRRYAVRMSRETRMPRTRVTVSRDFRRDERCGDRCGR